MIKERERANYEGPNSGNYRTRCKVVKVKEPKDSRWVFEAICRSVYARALSSDTKVVDWMAYLLRRHDDTVE